MPVQRHWWLDLVTYVSCKSCECWHFILFRFISYRLFLCKVPLIWAKWSWRVSLDKCCQWWVLFFVYYLPWNITLSLFQRIWESSQFLQLRSFWSGREKRTLFNSLPVPPGFLRWRYLWQKTDQSYMRVRADQTATLCSCWKQNKLYWKKDHVL